MRWDGGGSGPPRDINVVLARLLYDARDDYSGPAPLQVLVSDNNNFGVCTPPIGADPYRCSRSHCRCTERALLLASGTPRAPNGRAIRRLCLCSAMPQLAFLPPCSCDPATSNLH